MAAHTLLFALRGPQQSWGSRSRFSIRGTEAMPTRSGVIGLVAAALGLPRTASLDEFDDIRFGVRVDRPGTVERDFHTARTNDGESLPLSNRFYLADAVFLTGFESQDRALLERFASAIARPVFPLYLGRRGFPPAGPIRSEIIDDALVEALAAAPGVVDAGVDGRALPIYADALPGEPEELALRDVPRSFDPRKRDYAWRSVAFYGREPGVEMGDRGSPVTRVSAEHDPMTLVSDEEY